MNQKIKTVGITLALLVAHAGVSRASTGFRWWPVANTLRNQHGVNIAVSNATVLTFLSTNTTVDTIASAGQLILDNTVADDRFYHAHPNLLLGRYSTSYMNETGTELVGLFAYAVVLDRPFSLFTTFAEIPRDGSVQAAVTPMGWQPPGTAPAAIWDTVPAAVQSFTGGAVQTTLTVIPEPSVAGLLLVGAGVAVLRRRRARKMKMKMKLS